MDTSLNNRQVLRLIVLTLFVLSFVSGCQVETNSPPSQPAVTITSPAEPWYAVYFTNPEDPASASRRGGPDEQLASAMQAARNSVDVAVYDFSSWKLRDALMAAHDRGVQVRMVTESDNLDEPEIEELRQAGIEVLGDRREGLMHNKFAVIDRYEVWTGSTNFNIGSFYQNDNNLIRIRSSRLAEDYTTEFEEMFLQDAFGPGSPANTPYPNLTVDGTSLEVYFSPDDGVLAHLVELVSSAQDSVYFLAYSFTSDALAEALVERGQQGVDIRGVFEKDQYESNQGTEFDRLRKAGLDIRLDGNSKLMHHKVFIIDEKLVVTGSYNFSASAEKRNDENLLVVHDPQVAALYLQEFWRVFNLAGE